MGKIQIDSKSQRLSKSKVVLGLQCEKALYLTIHKRELAGEVSESQQMIFDQGHEVGIFAQKQFPDGVLVDAAFNETKKALEQTKKAIESGALAIIEATFEHENVLVKVDILHRKSAKAAWEIFEVKSSTGVKEVYLQDASVQLWVVRNAGLKVKKISIQHINNKCTYPNLDDLFATVDVTEECEELQSEIPKIVSRLQKMLKGSEPKISIGAHCSDPYPCAFQAHCFSKCKIPEISVFDIPSLKTELKWELYNAGKADLRTLDVEDFNVTQRRMIECTVAKKRFVDSSSILKEIKKWEYPMSFLDFETIAFAIPRYEGVKAYQQIPFQFSCHIKDSAKAKLKHVEYLHADGTDPREQLSKALAQLIPETSSVIAYNISFEKTVLLKLSDEFPKFSKKLKSIAERLVDPLPLFRKFVYDPGFCGSFSIKTVAPAILGKSASYEDLVLGDGSAAQCAFLEMIHADTTKVRKKELADSLIEYCTKDTMGMVQLVEWMFEVAK